ncbi:MAG TPA: heme ABC exporter ATP-binding protein CcmA [Vicinamibacterales bacterium]|jgi:heme ABC exporter ATP-binding subunit CcmA
MDFTSISFTDVTRSFGRRRALNRVSFACNAGDIVALLGPNGAGKSTLLSIAATLLQPSSGRVEYGGAPAQPDLRAHIGLLAHDLYLYPELTAAENLTFFARLHGARNPGVLVRAALDRAQLSDRADDPIGGFSRGMRQRLALERALLHDPRLVLLDEPFTGLDDASTETLVGRIRALGARGAIVLIATHDLEIVDGLISRAVMLREGRLVSIDSGPGTLRERFRRARH